MVRLDRLRQPEAGRLTSAGEADLGVLEPGHLARRRDRRIAASSAAALAARMLGVAVSIASIPLVIGYLGVERFGLWVTLTALTSMLAFADLGLGNGLLNIISESEGRGDRLLARRAVSTTFFALMLIAFGLIGLTAVIAIAIPWADTFGTSSDLTDRELVPAIVLSGILFAAGLPISVAERTRLGLQESYTTSAWVAVGAIGMLTGVLIAVSASASLPVLILLTAGPPLLATALNFGHLFLLQHPDLRPMPALVTRSLAPRLLHLGALFVVLQLAVAVAFQSDVVVAATVIGPGAAATYSIAARVFLFVPGLIGIVLATFWPAYGEAISRGDTEWVTRTLRRSTIGAAAVASASSAVLLVGSTLIFDWLTVSQLTVPIGLLLGFAAWAVISSSFNAIAMVLNAASVLTFQVAVALTMAVTSICLSVMLASAVGIAGVIWGTVIAYLAVTGIALAWYLPRFLRNLASRAAREGTAAAI